jgi:NADH dehydrogenase
MEILVTGGTGFIGSRLCTELDSRGHTVTALARNPDESDLPESIERAAGDVTDPASLEPAMAGMDTVVNLVALSPLFKPRGGNVMHDRVHRAGTENAVRAAEDAGVDRFVQLSGINADPNGPTAFLRAKGQAEELVKASELDWVIIRPTAVFGDGGEFIPFIRKVALPYLTPLPGGGRTRMQVIWVEDLVPMLADAVEGEEHVGQTYEIGGPDRLPLARIADLVHSAAGRSTAVIPIPMPLAGFGMTLGGMLPGFPFGADQYESLKLDLVVSENDVDAFGVDETELRSLADYLGVAQ